MRKFYISLLVFLASFVLPHFAFALTPLAPHAPGTNVLSNGVVYTIILQGEKRAYTSEGSFLSYGFNSWAGVVSANSSDLALPTGSFIPPQNGRIVCSDRGSDKGTCYLISAGARYGFVSEAVFRGLGFNFGRVLYGDVSFLPYPATINNANALHLPGVLVRDEYGTVSHMSYQGRAGFPSLAIFNSWGLSFSDVVPINSADRAVPQVGVVRSRIPGELDIQVDSAPPVVTYDLLQVYAPNGDEYWTVGETKQISWTSTHFDSQVNIYLDEYRYCSYYQPCPAVLQKSYTIATNIPDNGSYFWNVGSSLSGTVASGFYQIRITGANKTDISDTSDYPFSVQTAYELQQYQQDARNAKRLADIRQLMSGLELFFNDCNSYPIEPVRIILNSGYSLYRGTSFDCGDKTGSSVVNGGFGFSSGDVVYLGQVPTAPTPADGVCSAADNDYRYQSTSNGANYQLTFCLGQPLSGLSAGIHTATAAGIQ
jgi:hypothetical protein